MMLFTVGFVVNCCGIADDVDRVPANEALTVLGIPHICDSVVLTTLRAGLVGSHNFALTSGDIVLALLAPGAEEEEDDDCCAYTTSILLQTPKIKTVASEENTTKIKAPLFILMCESKIIININ
jgi:hypothetical protein